MPSRCKVCAQAIDTESDYAVKICLQCLRAAGAEQISTSTPVDQLLEQIESLKRENEQIELLYKRRGDLLDVNASDVDEFTVVGDTIRTALIRNGRRAQELENQLADACGLINEYVDRCSGEEFVDIVGRSMEFVSGLDSNVRSKVPLPCRADQQQSCKKCGATDGIDFMVKDDVWERVHEQYNVLCLGCFDLLAREKRVPYEAKILGTHSWMSAGAQKKVEPGSLEEIVSKAIDDCVDDKSFSRGWGFKRAEFVAKRAATIALEMAERIVRRYRKSNRNGVWEEGYAHAVEDIGLEIQKTKESWSK